MTSAPAGAGFSTVDACWVCGAKQLAPVSTAIFEFSAYARQDPDLARYSGATVALVRCRACGFGQPAALPSLPAYFDRMYDQRWSAQWLEDEFQGGTKDLIFRATLDELAAQLPPSRRRLLDLGAHVGRLLSLAAAAGWQAEGIELNPITSAYAERATGLPVHRADLRTLAGAGRRFDAITLIDVLEHIPDPVPALRAVRTVLAPGGCVVVQSPHGPNQLRKELIRGRIRPGYRPTVADNLVHVSHFTPRSLRLALERAGFDVLSVSAALPVLPPARPGAGRVLRTAFLRGVAGLARTLPGGVHTPLAMNLHAIARAP